MKRFFLILAAASLSAGLLNAQDLSNATNTFNNGAEKLQMGDKEGALKNFQAALEEGQALGDEGTELVDNCKSVIPNLMLSIGKTKFNEKDFEGAYEQIEAAAAVAKEYGDDSTLAEAEGLAPKALASKYVEEGNEAFAAKDYASAAPSYKQALEADGTNATASLRLVQSLANSGDIAGATEAYAAAEANGQGANAAKVLSGAYLKQAQASLKAGNNAEAIELANTANTYSVNANAYYIAGSASSKLGKTSDAISYYEKYLEAAPGSKNEGAIAYTVGALYQSQNNKTKALEYYNKAKAAGYADAQKAIDALK